MVHIQFLLPTHVHDLEKANRPFVLVSSSVNSDNNIACFIEVLCALNELIYVKLSV